MPLSKAEVKQRLEQLIFDEEPPQEWVQDVWGLSPTVGETAAKLLDVFEALVEHCPASQLNRLLQSLSSDEN